MIPWKTYSDRRKTSIEDVIKHHKLESYDEVLSHLTNMFIETPDRALVEKALSQNSKPVKGTEAKSEQSKTVETLTAKNDVEDSSAVWQDGLDAAYEANTLKQKTGSRKKSTVKKTSTSTRTRKKPVQKK